MDPQTVVPHTSSEYEEMLESLRNLTLQMGERVARQIEDAMEALASGSGMLVDQVLAQDLAVNELERRIDALCGQIIARRQPTAGDLRRVMAAVKATTDLERIGDEAKQVAVRARGIYVDSRPLLPRTVEARRMTRIVLEMLRAALAVFESDDVQRVPAILRRDAEVDEAFRGILRELITYMIEDPRTIGAALDIIFVAKAIERVGDHAKNLAEHAFYAVRGTDVRHAPLDFVEREAAG